MGLEADKYNSTGDPKAAKRLKSVIGSHMELCLGPSSNIVLKVSVSKCCLAAGYICHGLLWLLVTSKGSDAAKGSEAARE